MKRLTPFSWALIVIALLGATFFSVKKFAPDIVDTIFPDKHVVESSVPPKADLPDPALEPHAVTQPPPARTAQASEFPQITAEDLAHVRACGSGTEVRWKHWFWNTHTGVAYANGGPSSTLGSLMCQNGVILHLSREDDVPQQEAEMVAFATALKRARDRGEKNPNPSEGAHFISLMGDGTAAILTELNAQLEKLGPEYRAQVVGSGGYSRGEDCVMGPPEWKQNPQSARGGLCAAYLRDGDWNIGMKWLGDNGICNNPDETAYDPECFNWVNADNYIDAAQKYVQGWCETRPVVSKGKRTGESRKVCVNCAATWTPGDNIVADQRGGLVKIADTKMYYYQMPMAIIGVRAWMQANRDAVEGMLQAIFEGNQRIREDDAEMRRAAAIAAIVYNEPNADAAYVYRYFFGVTEPDKTGLMVPRGGSSVSNLADNCQLFGIQSCAPGSTSIYRATYEVFGNIVVQQYPKLVPRYQPYERVVDTSYIEAIASRAAPSAKAEAPVFAAADSTKPVAEVISRKSWNIEFKTGSAAFTNGAQEQLDRLFQDLVVAGAAAVEIHGHTDSDGGVEVNMRLSEARAFAVNGWLTTASPANFPEGRLRVFAHGSTQPLSPNTTAANKARNRRVEIVLGTN